MDSSKSHHKNKKKRTLIVVDGDALQEEAKYDFSFLEQEKRLEIWFFYKERIHHSFRLRRDFSAQNVVMPRYEEDTHLYLLKRVCFELGRRRERYRKVLLIGGHHPVWEGLVQFLRERDFVCTHILAEDYRIEEGKEIPRTLPASASSLPAEEKKSLETAEEVSALPKKTAPPSRKKTKEIYHRVSQLLRKLPAGTQMNREEFRGLLGKEGIRVKKDLPSQNLRFFLHRLAKMGYIQLEGDTIIISAHT
ncbi:MAG: hypothetical protein N2170_07400 [Bacteroidia bacterium]|nr:hypothetical protein [Bacteroidia bacterium]